MISKFIVPFVSLLMESPDMATCQKQKCATILRSENKTGYCSIHQPDPKREKNIHKPFLPYVGGPDQRIWDGFLMRIHAEAARAFDTTVAVLGGKDPDLYSPAQLAVQHLLAEFFKAPISAVARFGKVPRDTVAEMRYSADVLYRHDDGFREKYETVCIALKGIEHDILAECIDRASLSPRKEAYEEYMPYVRFVQTVGRARGGPSRTEKVS